MFPERLRGRTVALRRCALACGAALLMLGLLRPGVDAPVDRGRFVVALELRAEKEANTVWPHPAFSPARYEQVLVVAAEMPRLRPDTGGREPRPLSASAHLLLNGRVREPRRAASGSPGGLKEDPEEFVVGLEAGRLTLSLAIPSGAQIDPQHASAHIRLYEAVLRSPHPRGTSR